MTYMFTMCKNSQMLLNFEKFVKKVKNRFIVIANFQIRTTASSRLHWGNRRMGTVGSDDRGLRFWHRKTVKLQVIR